MLPPLSSTAVTADSTALRNAVTVSRHHGAPAGAPGDRRRERGHPGIRYARLRRFARLRKSQLEATGYYEVTVQTFLYDSFRELATPVFQRLSPSPRDFVANEDFITMDYSDTGDVTGTLVATNDIVIPPGHGRARSTAAASPATSRRRPRPSRRWR